MTVILTKAESLSWMPTNKPMRKIYLRRDLANARST